MFVDTPRCLICGDLRWSSGLRFDTQALHLWVLVFFILGLSLSCGGREKCIAAGKMDLDEQFFYRQIKTSGSFNWEGIFMKNPAILPGKKRRKEKNNQYKKSLD